MKSSCALAGRCNVLNTKLYTCSASSGCKCNWLGRYKTWTLDSIIDLIMDLTIAVPIRLIKKLETLKMQ